MRAWPVRVSSSSVSSSGLFFPLSGPDRALPSPWCPLPSPFSPDEEKSGGENNSKACAGCGAVGKCFRCSRCRLVFYCSKDCQASGFVDSFSKAIDDSLRSPLRPAFF